MVPASSVGVDECSGHVPSNPLVQPTVIRNRGRRCAPEMKLSLYRRLRGFVGSAATTLRGKRGTCRRVVPGRTPLGVGPPFGNRADRRPRGGGAKPLEPAPCHADTASVRRAVPLIVIVALVIGACGGSQRTATSSSARTSTADTGARRGALTYLDALLHGDTNAASHR
jgi:hypothetical protein